METVTTRVPEDGGEEVVALPEGMGFGVGAEVTVERNGDTVTIRPTKSGSVADMLDALARLPNPEGGWRRLPVDIPDRGSWWT